MNPYQPENPVNEQDLEQLRDDETDRLQAMGQSLGELRDDWIKARTNTGWDRRVRDDIDQYNSVDAANKYTESMMQTVERGYPTTPGDGTKPTRSTVFIGMTRQKTNGAEARLADILFPTDEKNWGIKPTPNPELARALNNEQPVVDPATGQPVIDPATGQPVTMSQVASKKQQQAEDAAEGMSREIDDQLNEADYNGEARKVLHNAAVMGTGVIKGPVVYSRQRKSWQRVVDPTSQSSVYVLRREQINKPGSESVDPRNVWEDPACGDDIQAGRGIFERKLMTAKQLRALAKQTGYMPDQIRKVLKEGPKPSAAMQEVVDQRYADALKACYEVWEYWGELEPADAEAAGLQVDAEDHLQSIDACVIMVNDTVIKAFVSPLETGELPYDYFPWEKTPDSPRGIGVPGLMRSQQKILNAAWRTMMDNAGASSGPQIIVQQQGVKPADGKWEITGRKIWWATDKTVDVRTVFNTFQVDSRQAELAGIIQLATQMADEETAVPMIMQGNERAAPETVGAMQMLMNASNVVLRRLVKQFDDLITKPHLSRYYDFNMLYSDKDDIKGDFDVDARGSSALLVRDIQNQAFMNLLAAAANPVFEPLIDPKKLFEKALQAQHVDPVDILRSDEEIKANAELKAQSGQQDPRVAVAQLRAETDKELATYTQERDFAELELKREMAQEEREFRREELLLTLETEMVKLAQTRELTLDQIKSRMTETAINNRTKKELFNAETNLKLATGQGI